VNIVDLQTQIWNRETPPPQHQNEAGEPTARVRLSAGLQYCEMDSVQTDETAAFVQMSVRVTLQLLGVTWQLHAARVLWSNLDAGHSCHTDGRQMRVRLR
jgi:hypothetical protein